MADKDENKTNWMNILYIVIGLVVAFLLFVFIAKKSRGGNNKLGWTNSNYNSRGLIHPSLMGYTH
jgi:hypothetical protein